MHQVKNVSLLPFFYLIPHEMLISTNYINIPRNPLKAVLDKPSRELIESDDFKLVVMDITAVLVWTSFGVSPYIHCFSGNDPLFRIAYALHLWEEGLDKINLSAQALLSLPSNVEMPWLSLEESQRAFYILGRYAIDKHNLQPVIDCIKQNRCHEDYDARMSNPKKDFFRSWYHTRSKTKVISLDAIIENNNGKNADEERYDILNDILDYSKIKFENDVVYKMDVEKYFSQLSEKDKKILALKYNGYAQKEIAKELGYKTHSAVGKRINKEIRRKYFEYFAWDD